MRNRELGNWFYTAKGRRFSLPDWGHLLSYRFFEGLGRRSLSVYLVHQLLLIAMLTAVGVARF